MLSTVRIPATEEFDGQNLTDEQKALQLTLTEEFQYELKKKLSSFDDINTSIRFFNIIHSKLDNKAIDFTYFNAPGFDFFDKKGAWNKNAGKIKENIVISCDGLNFMPHYEAMYAKINAVLYPEILDENDELTDKEKLILSAVVDQIQSEMSRKYASATSILNDSLSPLFIDEMIFKATYSSVRNILPELGSLIAIPASFESVNNIAIEQFPFPTVLDSPIEPLPSSANPNRMFKSASASDQNKSVSKKNDDQGGCKCRLF